MKRCRERRNERRRRIKKKNNEKEEEDDDDDDGEGESREKPRSFITYSIADFLLNFLLIFIKLPFFFFFF